MNPDTASDPRRDRIVRYLNASADLKRQVAADCLDDIVRAADRLIETFRAGRKFLLCGNGGSAADCQHMAAELTSLLTQAFPRPGLPAIALTTDTSFLTAFSNDFGFDGGFARLVQALGQPGDLLLGISTSGNSKSVALAVEQARALGLHSLVLTGAGGRLSGLADQAIVIPSRSTQHIQESMLAVEHLLCELVEVALFNRP